MIQNGTGSVEGCAGWYLVVLGQYRAVMVDSMLLGQYRAVLAGSWRFWVSIGWYWLIYDGTRSVQGGSG